MVRDVRDIANKAKRHQVFSKLKHEKHQERAKSRRKRQRERAALGEDAPPIPEAKTQDNQRLGDNTIVQPDDEEVLADVGRDEFSHPGQQTPKILVTTCIKPSRHMFDFVGEIMKVFPNSFYYKRGTYDIATVLEFAKKKGFFTDVMVLTEHRKRPYKMILSHLPEGPTAVFRIRKLVLTRQIKGHGVVTDHNPELILNRFTTRLGHRVGRMVASLFPRSPQFTGRRVVTFHNQRDFIFMRQHRYVFEETDGSAANVHGVDKDMKVRVRLQELGPRLTLKLVQLQEGTFDSQFAEFEWIRKKKDEEMQRRKFAL